MVTHDRIRLTGLLRKKPWKQGFFYALATDTLLSTLIFISKVVYTWFDIRER
jgi:hypothetical protein